MRKYFFSHGLATVAIVAAVTAIPFTPARAQIITEGTLVTDYIWRGFNQLNGAPAFQPDVTFILGDTGLDFNVWASWALRDRDNKAIRNLDELDLTLTYSHKFGPVAAHAGALWLSWYRMEGHPDKYSTFQEAFAGFGLPDLPLSPSMRFNYELADYYGHDIYIELNAEHAIMLHSDSPLLLALHGGWYDADWIGSGDGFSGISDLSLSVSLPQQSRELTVIPWFSLTYVPPEEINSDHLEFTGGITVAGVFLTD